MLLMKAIADDERAMVPAPPEASPGLASVIERLLTRDPAQRLTLAQLRHDPWLTDDGAQILPIQPVVKVEISEEEIEQAVTNRAAIAVGSAAGPSAFGAALALIGSGNGSVSGSSGGWKREGLGTIRKRSDEGEATFWKAISASGHLAPHLPLLYSINDEEDKTSDGRRIFHITMQDLVAPMTRPCALALVMGNRTVTSNELSAAQAEPRADLLARMVEIDASGPTSEEAAAGGVSAKRFLRFLDESTSTASLGFRIDAAKTVVGSDEEGTPSLAALPLNPGQTYETLKDEDSIVSAFASFLQKDGALALAFAQKVQSLLSALGRSAFFQKHVLLRSTLLLVYDDASRGHEEPLMECKIMNFGSSYALPEGKEGTVTHTAEWDGTAESHEDGYLAGVQSLDRILAKVCDECAASAPPTA